MTFWDKLPNPFFVLAPMEEVTDIVFRKTVARAGRPDVFFTEFTNAASYCSEQGRLSTEGRLKHDDSEQPIVAQIWGTEPEHFRIMAAGLKEQGFSGIDINMGCPAKDVVKIGAGSGMIGNIELAGQVIAAAQASGLPVSVKTRLGRSRTSEWRDWIGFLLQQDLANLTVHLRTRKEMSKVDAHYELIDDICALRDQVAPATKITINGDVRDRTHGLQLKAEHPGVDGFMIGRGVFANPFCFEQISASHPAATTSPACPPREGEGAASTSPLSTILPRSQATGASLYPKGGENTSPLWLKGAAEHSEAGGSYTMPSHPLSDYLDLFRYQLDQYDKYRVINDKFSRKFDPLKHFFKIYIKGFDGAADLRVKLYDCTTTDQVRAVLDEYFDKK